MQNTDFANPTYQLTNQQRKDMKLRYYTTDVHKAAFALPAFLVDALEDAWHGTYLQHTHLMHATCPRQNQKYYVYITHYITCPLSQIKRLFHLLNTVSVKPNLLHMCNGVLLFNNVVRNYFLKTLKNTKSNVSVKLLTGSVLLLLLSRTPSFSFGYISFSFF